jgi:flagellar motor switch/type III secretory pathway protein FliN
MLVAAALVVEVEQLPVAVAAVVLGHKIMPLLALLELILGAVVAVIKQ